MLVDFGVMSVDDLVNGRLKGASRPDFSYPLYEFLQSLEPLDAFAVLLIDEAQNLPLPLLEEIRILSDLEAAGRSCCRSCWWGSPSSTSPAAAPHAADAAAGDHALRLQPLGARRRVGLRTHRLHVAGATPDQLRLTDEALDLVFEASGGVPRVINRLCDRALTHGHSHARRASGRTWCAPR